MCLTIADLDTILAYITSSSTQVLEALLVGLDLNTTSVGGSRSQSTSIQNLLFALAQYLKGRGACVEVVAALMAAAARTFVDESRPPYGYVGPKNMNCTGLKRDAVCSDWNVLLAVRASLTMPCCAVLCWNALLKNVVGCVLGG